MLRNHGKMELPRFHYFLSAQPYMTVQQGQPSSATRLSLLSRISLSSVFDFSSPLPKNLPVWCFSLTSSQFDRDVWKQGWEPILAGLKLRVRVLAEHGVSQLDFVVPDLKRDGLGVRAVRLETTLDGVTGGTSEALTLRLVHMQVNVIAEHDKLLCGYQGADFVARVEEPRGRQKSPLSARSPRFQPKGARPLLFDFRRYRLPDILDGTEGLGYSEIRVFLQDHVPTLAMLLMTTENFPQVPVAVAWVLVDANFDGFQSSFACRKL